MCFLGSSRRIRSLVSPLNGKLSKNSLSVFHLRYMAISLVLFPFKVWHLLMAWVLDIDVVTCSMWLRHQQNMLWRELSFASSTALQCMKAGRRRKTGTREAQGPKTGVRPPCCCRCPAVSEQSAQGSVPYNETRAISQPSSWRGFCRECVMIDLGI